MTDYAPLEVTAVLSGPIHLPGGPLALDALLMAQAAKESDAPVPATAEELRSLPPVDIPVKKSECGRIWLASFSAGKEAAHEIVWMHRRAPVEEIARIGRPDIRRVNVTAGANKSYRIPLSLRHYKGNELKWWCIGDAEEVARLLRGVSALGKKRAHGHGEVASWRVEPVEEVWPGFPVLKDGWPLRPLPLDWPGLRPEVPRRVRTLTPPYWDHSREELVAWI